MISEARLTIRDPAIRDFLWNSPCLEEFEDPYFGPCNSVRNSSAWMTNNQILPLKLWWYYWSWYNDTKSFFKWQMYTETPITAMNKSGIFLRKTPAITPCYRRKCHGMKPRDFPAKGTPCGNAGIQWCHPVIHKSAAKLCRLEFYLVRSKNFSLNHGFH